MIVNPEGIDDYCSAPVSPSAWANTTPQSRSVAGCRELGVIDGFLGAAVCGIGRAIWLKDAHHPGTVLSTICVIVIASSTRWMIQWRRKNTARWHLANDPGELATRFGSTLTAAQQFLWPSGQGVSPAARSGSTRASVQVGLAHLSGHRP